MSFGVEIEAGFSTSLNSTYFSIFLKDKYGATLKSDGSIHTMHKPHEVATRKYNESEIKKFKSLLKCVYGKITEINDSMGLHIHFSKDIDTMNTLYNRRFVLFFKRELLKAFPNNELLHNRLKNRYCKFFYKKDYFLISPENMGNRYKMINWCAWAKHKTVEFRVFNVPRTAEEALNYVLFTLDTINRYVARYKKKTITQEVTLLPEETEKKVLTLSEKEENLIPINMQKKRVLYPDGTWYNEVVFPSIDFARGD